MTFKRAIKATVVVVQGKVVMSTSKALVMGYLKSILEEARKGEINAEKVFHYLHQYVCAVFR